MKTTSSVAFYCRASKSDKKGFSPIELSINISGSRTFINLPRKEKPAEFLKSMSRRGENDIKNFCEEYRKKVNEIMTQLLAAGRTISTITIKEALASGVMTTITISKLWDEYLLLLKERIGKDLTFPVYKKYAYVCACVINIIGDIDIKRVGIHEAKQIQTWLYNNYKTSTAAGYLTKAKTIFRYAFDCGYISSNPFGQVKVKKGNPDTTYLTQEELSILENTTFGI